MRIIGGLVGKIVHRLGPSWHPDTRERLVTDSVSIRSSWACYSFLSSVLRRPLDFTDHALQQVCIVDLSLMVDKISLETLSSRQRLELEHQTRSLARKLSLTNGMNVSINRYHMSIDVTILIKPTFKVNRTSSTLTTAVIEERKGHDTRRHQQTEKVIKTDVSISAKRLSIVD